MSEKTSEEIHGITKQPKEQCPLIDDLICKVTDEAKNVGIVYRDLKDIPEAEENTSLNDLDWADFNLRNLEAEIETIRTNIVELRNWGQEWKDFALTINEKHNPNQVIFE
jgi:hypothetical protein